MTAKRAGRDEPTIDNIKVREGRLVMYTGPAPVPVACRRAVQPKRVIRPGVLIKLLSYTQKNLKNQLEKLISLPIPDRAADG